MCLGAKQSGYLKLQGSSVLKGWTLHFAVLQGGILCLYRKLQV